MYTQFDADDEIAHPQLLGMHVGYVTDRALIGALFPKCSVDVWAPI